MAHDLADKEIAARLGISESTVRKHFESGRRKLGRRGRTGFVIAWLISKGMGENAHWAKLTGFASPK